MRALFSIGLGACLWVGCSSGSESGTERVCATDIEAGEVQELMDHLAAKGIDILDDLGPGDELPRKAATAWEVSQYAFSMPITSPETGVRPLRVARPSRLRGAGRGARGSPHRRRRGPGWRLP